MKIRPADINNESATNGYVLTLSGGVAVWAAAAGGGGSGTVTSVSVTTANGVSGSVATSTTTPAISITLGAITPSSVAATGTVTGSNLSGTNTGDQTTVSGNAGSATVLQTARTINGVSFDGSANISVNTNNSVTWDNSGTGAASGATFNGSAAKTISYNTIGAQAASSQLTALAGAAWSAGTQVVTLSAANTVTLKTVGQATGNILDKAAGDALYQATSSQLTAVAGAAWSAGTQLLSLTAANTVTLKTVGSATGNILDKASGDSLYAPVSGSANYQAANTRLANIASASPTGTQLAAYGASNAITLYTIGSSTGNILDKASGDSLYKPKDPVIYTASVTGATTVDCTGYDVLKLTLTGNLTLTLSNIVDGKTYKILFIQDGTGSRTVTLNAQFKFGTDVTAYTASTAASKTDDMGVWIVGTNVHVIGVAKGY